MRLVGHMRPIGAMLALLLLAAEPVVTRLDVRGFQAGATTTVTIDGDGLAGARLLLPFAAKQVIKPGATARRAVFDVTVGNAVPAGFCNLRVVGEGGISLPVAIALDALPQRPFAADAGLLPVALHGSLTGGAVVSTRFIGKAGEKVAIEAEAQRLGSRLRPVVHLYNAKKRQLAWAWTKPALGGDARFTATLPADGEYTVSLHDAEYAGGSPGHFRLKIGRWDRIGQVFPPVVARGRKSIELLFEGGATRADVLPSGLVVWPPVGTWSGARPFVTFSDHAEIESTADSKPQLLPAGPIGVSGKLKARGEARFRIPVKPGQKVRLEAFAERLGSSLHVALVVRNEMGAQLARAEESANTLDPSLVYTVPARTTSLVVSVSATDGSGVYRFVVDGEEKGFRLTAKTGRVVLPLGGKCVVPVLLERRGYPGAVELSAALPPGVRMEGTTIASGTDGTLVTVLRGTSAFDAALSRWVGKGSGQEDAVRVAGSPLAGVQPWTAEVIALAPSAARSSDFEIAWRGTPPAGIVPTRKLALPVKVTRPAGNTFVRLTLLTSQAPPLVNGQPDVNRSIRIERATELAPKKDEGELPLVVPAELPATSYEVAVRADLLAADRRTVLGTAYTPDRRLPVRMPLVVATATRVEARGAPRKPTTAEITGKVERREGLTGDVTLALTGLPPGVSPGPLVVKASRSDFTIKLNIPASLAPGEYRGLKLAASAVADPRRPGLRVTSRSLSLTLVLK